MKTKQTSIMKTKQTSIMKTKNQKGGNPSCVTAGGCSKPKPPRLKPEVERSVAAGIDRQTRGNESERRRLYQSAGIPYQSVSASTRPARTLGVPGNQKPEIKKEPKVNSRNVVKKRPEEQTISRPDTIWKYYEGSMEEKNLKATSRTPLSSFPK